MEQSFPLICEPPPIETVALLLDLFHFIKGRWDHEVPSRQMASDS